MVCRNINNGITVCFLKTGKMVTGKIQDMPMELLQQWAALPDGHMYIQNAVMEAEEVFFEGYVGNVIENGGISEWQN